MNDKTTTVEELKNQFKIFIKDRDWQQFHTPKNVAMSIAIEAAELMEHFQWINEQQSKEVFTFKRTAIEDEVADIFSYLLSFCIHNNIDLTTALTKKLEKTNKKYPANIVKGKADKYTTYQHNE